MIDSALSLSSGNATSGIYTGTWVISNTSEAGNFKVYFYACTLQVCNSSSELSFTVNSTLSLNASLKSQYMQGENIEITGYIKDFNGNLTPAALSLLLKSGSFQKSINKSSSANYNLSYRISLDEPAGTWTADISAVDIYNNSGKTSVSFTVTEPKKTEQYSLEIVEPKDNSVLKRGDKIRITATLKKGEEKISGANVVVKLPSGKQIVLDEAQAGVYSKEYVVGLDEPLGAAVISVDGLKGELSGSKSISAAIRQAELKIEPEILGYKPGEAIEIKAKIAYADGSVATADASAFIDGKKISLAKKDGYYSGLFMIEKEGIYDLRIDANDGFGNSGVYETKVSISERNIFDYIVQNWHIIASALAVSLFVLYKTGKLSSFAGRIKMKQLLSRQKVLEQKRRKTQESYFEKKNIGKGVYDKMINETESELLKIRGEIKKIRK